MTETKQHGSNNEDVLRSHRDDLLAAAKEARGSAYAPYSHFAVGAAAMLSDGSIYRGCNIENASYGLAVCAERVALFHAVCDGRLDIVAIAVVTNAPNICKPCGACRQVIAEFSHAGNPIVVISALLSGESETETIVDLLPDTFSLV
jgi:cytidine deaminase